MMQNHDEAKDPPYGTTSSAFVSNALDACVSLGCARPLLISKIPGGEKALQNPAKRFNSKVLIDLLHYAEDLSGKVGIGVLTGSFLRPSAMADLGQAMIVSHTLEEMINLYRAYQPLLIQIGQTEILKDDTQAYITWDTELEDTAYLRPYVEKFFGGLAAFGRWITWDQDLTIISVHFCHAEPKTLTAYNDVFRCPLHFRAKRNMIVVSHKLIEHPMPQPNPALLANIREILDRDLADLNHPLTTARNVFLQIRSVLSKGQPSITDIAEALGTTERTLRRRLKTEEASYRRVLEDVRREACAFELNRGNISIPHLAKALGYLEPSAFTRAFKSWYGVPPSQYIRQYNKIKK